MPKHLKQTGQLAPLDQPWQLIRDALDDLKLNENSENLEINMAHWITPAGDVCHVCLAGGMAARRCNMNVRGLWHPGSPYEEDNASDVDRIMYAINAFRQGNICGGLGHLGLKRPPGFADNDRYIPRYVDDRKGFYRELGRLADDLEKAFTAK
jgi:hypothetical protein